MKSWRLPLAVLLIALLVSGCAQILRRGEGQPPPKEPPTAGEQPPQKPPAAAVPGPQPELRSKNFIITSAIPARVGTRLALAGQARAFEAMFSVIIEDGHAELARHHVMAKEGAPAFGDFQVELDLLPASQSTGTLIIGTHSAKDGTFQPELTIPITFETVQFHAEEPAGPAAGYLPVKPPMGRWDATGQSPEEVARRFVLGDEPCECADVRVAPVISRPTESTIRVTLSNMFDDSIATMDYYVNLRRKGNRWEVVASTYSVQCRRGVTAGGLCV